MHGSWLGTWEEWDHLCSRRWASMYSWLSDATMRRTHICLQVFDQYDVQEMFGLIMVYHSIMPRLRKWIYQDTCFILYHTILTTEHHTLRVSRNEQTPCRTSRNSTYTPWLESNRYRQLAYWRGLGLEHNGWSTTSPSSFKLACSKRTQKIYV